MFDGNKAEMVRRVRAALEPALAPGEELLGATYATKSATFSHKQFAIGVTPHRLILLELDRRFAANGEPITVRPSDITKSSIDGWDRGVGQLLATNSVPQIRFDTTGETWKFVVLGGTSGEALMGPEYVRGLELVCEFLAAAAANR